LGDREGRSLTLQRQQKRFCRFQRIPGIRYRTSSGILQLAEVLLAGPKAQCSLSFQAWSQNIRMPCNNVNELRKMGKMAQVLLYENGENDCYFWKSC
jgi:hypothetical protein